ncbi:MAG TPA: cytochrome c3 family protein [Croceibacterium sp.]|nr:cytochrome c3 family protein [Croceibacterium sp.]
MPFRIRTVDVTATGREIVRERELGQAELTIGRAAENDIHLPDLAVEQRHVRVVPATGGKLRLEALGKLAFTVDARPVEEAAIIDPSEGAELAIGSYRLEFLEEDGAVVIVVRKIAAREGSKVDDLAGFSLAHVLPGNRPVAWIGLLAILLAFLAVPVWSHMTRTRHKPDYDRAGAVLMDASWRTGALSSAHHGLEDNCEACHVQAFVAVRDAVCVACHTDIVEHAARPRQAVARGPLARFEQVQWNVAHAFSKPGPGACTDCHTEHEGSGPMERTRERFCADCHGSLDARLADTALANAGDFGTHHPQFKAALVTGPTLAEVLRVSLDRRPRQWTGLRFPHEMHLSRTNGVAQMARRLGARGGYGDPLECADCHRPTEDGVRFMPVAMEQDCEACHSLVYDRIGTTFRTLRHGNIEQMRADLLALDARAPRVTGRRRPGQYGTLYRADFGGPGTALLSRAMGEKGLCGECHTPAGGRGSLQVQPVPQPMRYFVNGWFDHEDHKQEQCTSCHAADRSDASSDLLLPGVGQCRDCHMGESNRTAEVPSSCAMCHSYHPRNVTVAALPRIARR